MSSEVYIYKQNFWKCQSYTKKIIFLTLRVCRINQLGQVVFSLKREVKYFLLQSLGYEKTLLVLTM